MEATPASSARESRPDRPGIRLPRRDPLVQRSLGLAAFRRGSLVELLLRDLPTYLRQPAPDETLAEAAAYFMQHDFPVIR